MIILDVIQQPLKTSDEKWAIYYRDSCEQFSQSTTVIFHDLYSHYSIFRSLFNIFGFEYTQV